LAYDLLADQESIRVAREGLRYAQQLLENNEVEVKIGAVARYDVVRSKAEVASRRQDLLAAQHTFSQDAQSLKAEISKSFNEGLATVEIAPTDRLPEPHPDDVPTLAEAMREAARYRPEIEQAELNLRNQEATIRAIRTETTASFPRPCKGKFSVHPTFPAHQKNRIRDSGFSGTLRAAG